MVNLNSHQMPNWFATCVSQKSLATAESWLGQMNFRCYQMRSISIREERSLFNAVLGAVGTTPAGSGLTDETRSNLKSWDGAEDYLYQELVSRPDKRVAILWLEADQMLRDRLQLFLNALEWLESFAGKLAHVDENKSWSIILTLILLGEGLGFPPAIQTVYVPTGKNA